MKGTPRRRCFFCKEKENKNDRKQFKKCPKCGATDISMNEKTGKLRCNFCRFEFDGLLVNQDTEDDVFQLNEEIISDGLRDIKEGAQNLITLKCTACGAEVVIDTNETMQARCHWCRNTLSVNTQIENGAVCDMILPFKTPKTEAQAMLQTYIKNHNFFALPRFLKEFSIDNIMPVYFPYMIIDANVDANFQGTGEIEKRRYTVKVGKDSEETRYDADLYNIGREFKMGVDDLIVESSSKRMDGSEGETNNIINAILPFDTENCVEFDANYMKGCNSERRDVNIEDMRETVKAQIKDIARYNANKLSEQYDRGICWSREDITYHGMKWKSAYLPVWLYSYYQKNNGMLHYVAVNARTNEMIGSIPINKIKLVMISLIIEIVSFIMFVMVIASDFLDDSDGEDPWYLMFMLTLGFIFYFWQHWRYRQNGERHYHEKETRSYVKEGPAYDEFVCERKRLKKSMYEYANNERVEGVILNMEDGKIKDIVNRFKENE